MLLIWFWIKLNCSCWWYRNISFPAKYSVVLCWFCNFVQETVHWKVKVLGLKKKTALWPVSLKSTIHNGRCKICKRRCPSWNQTLCIKVTRGYSPRPCGHQDVRIRLSLITHWLGLQPFISIQGELGEQIHIQLSFKVACIMWASQEETLKAYILLLPHNSSVFLYHTHNTTQFLAWFA